MTQEVFGNTVTRRVRTGFVPWLPPSINEGYTIYKVGKSHTIGSSPALRAFKKNASKVLSLMWRGALPKSRGYLLVLTFQVKQLETKQWLSCHDQNKREGMTRWVRRDVSNWVKYAEDVCASAAGIDDAANLVVVARKVQGPEGFTVDIYELAEQGVEDFEIEYVEEGDE